MRHIITSSFVEQRVGNRKIRACVFQQNDWVLERTLIS